MPIIRPSNGFFVLSPEENHFSGLGPVFSCQRLQERHTDVKIYCDGGALKAHKMIFVRSNVVMSSMEFRCPSEDLELILPNVSIYTMQDVLQILYEGRVGHVVNLQEVVEVIELLGIEGSFTQEVEMNLVNPDVAVADQYSSCNKQEMMQIDEPDDLQFNFPIENLLLNSFSEDRRDMEDPFRHPEVHQSCQNLSAPESSLLPGPETSPNLTIHQASQNNSELRSDVGNHVAKGNTTTLHSAPDVHANLLKLVPQRNLVVNITRLPGTISERSENAKNDTVKNVPAKNVPAKNDSAKNDSAKNDSAKNDPTKNSSTEKVPIENAPTEKVPTEVRSPMESSFNRDNPKTVQGRSDKNDCSTRTAKSTVSNQPERNSNNRSGIVAGSCQQSCSNNGEKSVNSQTKKNVQASHQTNEIGICPDKGGIAKDSEEIEPQKEDILPPAKRQRLETENDCQIYKCDLCNSTFPIYRNLLRHYGNIHFKQELEKNFAVTGNVCSVCGKKMRKKSNLLWHLANVHEGLKNYVPVVAQPTVKIVTKQVTSPRKTVDLTKPSTRPKRSSTGSNVSLSNDDPTKINCFLCRKVFPRTALLNRHYVTEHFQEEISKQSHLCTNTCEKFSASGLNKILHLAFSHDGFKKIIPKEHYKPGTNSKRRHSVMNTPRHLQAIKATKPEEKLDTSSNEVKSHCPHCFKVFPGRNIGSHSRVCDVKRRKEDLRKSNTSTGSQPPSPAAALSSVDQKHRQSLPSTVTSQSTFVKKTLSSQFNTSTGSQPPNPAAAQSAVDQKHRQSLPSTVTSQSTFVKKTIITEPAAFTKYPCHFCSVARFTVPMIKLHYSKIHLRDEIFQKFNINDSTRECPICKQSEGDLANHLSEKHEGLKGLLPDNVYDMLKKEPLSPEFDHCKTCQKVIKKCNIARHMRNVHQTGPSSESTVKALNSFARQTAETLPASNVNSVASTSTIRAQASGVTTMNVSKPETRQVEPNKKVTSLSRGSRLVDGKTKSDGIANAPGDVASGVAAESNPKLAAQTEVTPTEAAQTKTYPKEITPTEAAQTKTYPKEVAPKEITATETAPKEVAPKEITATETAPKEVAPKKITATETAPKEVTPTEAASLEASCVNGSSGTRALMVTGQGTVLPTPANCQEMSKF